MPIDALRIGKLDEFLKTVTPATAVRLAQAVELDRLRGGALPHATILSALRPHLRRASDFATRMPTAQRIVCGCFEDLLVDRRSRKQRGRIARSSITPVWAWLVRELGDAGARALDAISAKMLKSGPDFAGAEIDAFHALAAPVILAAMPDAASDAGLARMIGRDVAADAHDMARMMQIGEEIRDLQARLPRPIGSLEEEDIWTIRGYWEQVIEQKPDCAPYVAFFVLGRLQRPWEIMRLAGALSRRLDDILVSRTDAGHVGELLLSDIEDCVARLAAMRVDQTVAAEVLEAVESFAQISTGIVRELGIKRDGAWGKRLMAARSAMSEQMERLLGRAVRDITATLPMSRRSSFSLHARRTPDMSKRLDPQKAERAIVLATIIGGAKPHAMAGAFAGFLTEVEEKTVETLRHYTEEMFDELRTADEGTTAQATAYVSHAIELSRLILGKEEAELIRRRAAAAVAAHGETAAA
ncbi:MAG: hypothetical protein IT548_09365 [Alphaproteobacteria bacterium]|nr:hypothetical protein [Alphaproteobacteria bacterium]